nr:MAG: hypothetical protein H4Bulk461620_000001 [Mitovirus sp.]
MNGSWLAIANNSKSQGWYLLVSVPLREQLNGLLLIAGASILGPLT